MNKKIVWGIIFVLVIIGIVFAVNRIGASRISFGKGQIYIDSTHEFQVSYPSGWEIIKNISINKGGFTHTVFGPVGTNTSSQSTLVIETRNDMTAAQVLKGILDVENTRASTSTVNVSDIFIDNISAKLIIVSNGFMRRSVSGWQPEYIVLEMGSTTYELGNGGIENGLFKNFYQSFEFVNATSSSVGASSTSK